MPKPRYRVTAGGKVLFCTQDGFVPRLRGEGGSLPVHAATSRAVFSAERLTTRPGSPRSASSDTPGHLSLQKS